MTRTTCPYCGVGCGINVTEAGPGGDLSHPANFGRLCVKGAALKETLSAEGRLTVPLIHGREASWDEALDFIAGQLLRIRAEHGPDAIAFYVSGQFLTEDYYIANKLMKGFIGSGNIDTNSRLCMASSVAGHIRAFGEDVVPGCYEDLEQADLVIQVGSNMAWCHPVLYQRLMASREKRGTKIVTIDPRRTATADTADLHLAITPGSDVMLWNGLLARLADCGKFDSGWTNTHVSGLEETLATARCDAPSLTAIAAATGLAAEDVSHFYDLFAATERVVTLYSQGVNQSSSGSDKVNAILNCHLATGRLGRPGMGPFSLTGQPNAMGGREVGGLANQLAAHMLFTGPDIDRVRRFWRAPTMATRPGYKAVDMFNAVANGQVQTLWIAATNPADSMPRADHVRDALKNCALVIASDAWPTDTTRLAHVVLPAASWGEKDGTVTNSERCISRQRAFRAPPGLARPDWWMFAEVARRMGWAKSFSYAGPADIFREHAALSTFENDGSRIFDIGAMADLDDAAYDALAPVRWPFPKNGDSTARLFGTGGFPTPDGRARMIPVASRRDDRTAEFPLSLNTGRTRDQWHTMTRTGRVARLMTHAPAPVLTLHPADAMNHGVQDGGLVQIASADGVAMMRAELDAAQRPGDVFAAMHWTDLFTSSGPIDRLVHAKVDPLSGQPDLKNTPVRIAAVAESWRGDLLRTEDGEPGLSGSVWWSKVQLEGGFGYRLSGWSPLKQEIDSELALRRLLQVPAGTELLSYSDSRSGVFRYAGFAGSRLLACVFFGPPGSDFHGRESAARLLGKEVSAADRMALLAGVTADGVNPAGRMVCACFSVPESAILDAIRRQRLTTPAQIGAALKAGTNCGSCVPEISKLLAETSLVA